MSRHSPGRMGPSRTGGLSGRRFASSGLRRVDWLAGVPPSPHHETLVGVLERVVFLNEENAYTIAEFQPEQDRRERAGARAERVTIVGALPGVECGETLHLTGEWVQHRQHGRQFRVASFRSQLPSSVHGIRKYLGSGLVPGIGKVYAEKIVDVFGVDTFRVLSEESARLREVPGIGPKRVTAIKRAWDSKRVERELFIFLQTYGVTPSQCMKLVQRYGAEAKTILQSEPYRVAREIDGIGFRTADKIAINLGFANDAPPRLDGGILFALDELQEEGHTACPEQALVDKAAELLETPSRDRLEARIRALVESKQLVRHEAGPVLQLPTLDRAERKIADAVTRLLRVHSVLPPIKAEVAVDWAQQKAGFSFADQQRVAVLNALRSKVSILTGGPGTGKTTCLRALVEVLKAKRVRVHLAAPTGRASQRLAEATGGFASTIHRLLRFDPGRGAFTANEDSPLATDFLIVDEASMLDARLASALLQAVPARAHVLLVGDTDQLPSVGAGNVLKDLISSAEGRFPVTRLSVVYRQQGHSAIVTTAHAINDGDASLPPVVAEVADLPGWSELAFIQARDAEDCVDKVVRLCTEYIPTHCRWLDPVGDVQVLAPMHKGVAGVANLNARLQQALNVGAAGQGAPAGAFRAGDKVIQLRNNYDKNLFNGDIGTVVSAGGEAALEVDFDGERHPFSRAEMGDLALAYCISIHKSQGSEYPVVILPLMKAHFMMLQRNLLYTGLTRGKKRVYIVGEPAAYAMAVRNNESRVRHTWLKQRLEETR